MKKCKGCNKEIDKYAIACQYCGRMLEKDEPTESSDSQGKKANQGMNEKT